MPELREILLTLSWFCIIGYLYHTKKEGQKNHLDSQLKPNSGNLGKPYVGGVELTEKNNYLMKNFTFP